MDDRVAAALFTSLGWFLGFLSRTLETRWKGANSLRGTLRACMDDHRAITTHAFGGGGEPSGAELKSASEVLVDDSIRLREVLIQNPRFGNDFWSLYRRLRYAATQLISGNVPTNDDWTGMFDLAHELSRRGTWWLFLPFAARRAKNFRDKGK